MVLGVTRPKDEERPAGDFYATCPSTIPPLLEFLGWLEDPKTIREPTCGQGHLSVALEHYGHIVVSTDLYDRGYGLSPVDFIDENDWHWTDDIDYDAVIMNPPYKNNMPVKFVETALEISPVVCAFLRGSFLESASRDDMFNHFPPEYMLVFSDRVRSSKNALFKPKEQNTVMYAWFVWNRGYKGDTKIKRIKTKPELLNTLIAPKGLKF